MAVARGSAEAFHSDHGEKGTKMVKRATKKAEVLPAVSAGRDSGVTFIEVLVSLVLLGTVLIGVLTATRATVMGSALERDHSKAQQWLQSASGVLQAVDLHSCDLTLDPTGDGIRDAYQLAIDAPGGAATPEGWTGTAADITILLPKVWNGTAFVDYSAQTTECYDANELRQQLITIQVTDPDGRIIETVEVVKRDLPGS